MTSLDCGSRKVHLSLPGGSPAGEAASCTVPDSAATSAIGIATGVAAEPMMTSTLSSVDQALRVLDAGGRVGGVVEHHHLEVLAGDGLGPQRDLVLDRDAQARGRAGQRQHDADREVGMGGAEEAGGQGGGEEFC